MPQIPGHCFKFQDTATHFETLLQTPGNCLKFRDNVSNSGTLLQIPGHCLKFLETVSNSGTLSLIAGHCLKSGNVSFLVISFYIYYSLNVYQILGRKSKTAKDLKLSLSVPRKHIGEAEVQIYSFLTSSLDRAEWATSRPDCFTPWGKKKYLYSLNKMAVDHTSGPDDCYSVRISCFLQGF